MLVISPAKPDVLEVLVKPWVYPCSLG